MRITATAFLVTICCVLAVGCSSVRVSAPSKPIVWFIVLDRSASTPGTMGPDWFDTCKKRIIPAIALCRIRARDEVYFAPLDDHTDDGQTRSFVFKTGMGLAGVGPEIGSVRDEIWKWQMADPTGKGGTDFGGAVRWIAANVNRIKSQSAKGDCPRFVALFFTDGYADGWQAPTREDRLPADVDVYILATAKRDLDHSLENVLAGAGVDVGRVKHFPYGDWEATARAFGKPYERPQNEPLLELIESGKKITARSLLSTQ